MPEDNLMKKSFDDGSLRFPSQNVFVLLFVFYLGDNMFWFIFFSKTSELNRTKHVF